MITIVYTGETETQAEARAMQWRQERRELLGYRGDLFIFRGRQCVSSTQWPRTTEYRRVSQSVTFATARHKQKLERERPELLRARALREARNFREAVRLMERYGVA